MPGRRKLCPWAVWGNEEASTVSEGSATTSRLCPSEFDPGRLALVVSLCLFSLLLRYPVDLAFNSTAI